MWCSWRYFRVVGTTFAAPGAAFSVQVQQFDSPGTTSARLGPGCFCLTGAAFGAPGAAFVWQVQHLVLLELLLRGQWWNVIFGNAGLWEEWYGSTCVRRDA